MPNQDDDSLPEEVKELIEDQAETIEKTAKISHDGRQHVVRIPSTISENIDIEKGDRLNFRAIIPPRDSDEPRKLEIEYQRNDD